MSEKGWKVIGISGATNAGKTSLATKLIQTFPTSLLLNQDDYFWKEEDPNHVWVEIKESGRMHQNWELVSSIDWLSLERDVQNILSSPPPGDSPGFLFLEGHLIFNHEPMKELFHLRIFLTLPKEVCFERRVARDYLPPDPHGYFEQIVWPMYLINLNHVRSIYSDDKASDSITFLDGTQHSDYIFEHVAKQIRDL